MNQWLYLIADLLTETARYYACHMSFEINLLREVNNYEFQNISP